MMFLANVFVALFLLTGIDASMFHHRFHNEKKGGTYNPQIAWLTVHNKHGVLPEMKVDQHFAKLPNTILEDVQDRHIQTLKDESSSLKENKIYKNSWENFGSDFISLAEKSGLTASPLKAKTNFSTDSLVRHATKPTKFVPNHVRQSPAMFDRFVIPQWTHPSPLSKTLVEETTKYFQSQTRNSPNVVQNYLESSTKLPTDKLYSRLINKETRGKTHEKTQNAYIRNRHRQRRLENVSIHPQLLRYQPLQFADLMNVDNKDMLFKSQNQVNASAVAALAFLFLLTMIQDVIQQITTRRRRRKRR